jgi:hypothetical protein
MVKRAPPLRLGSPLSWNRRRGGRTILTVCSLSGPAATLASHPAMPLGLKQRATFSDWRQPTLETRVGCLNSRSPRTPRQIEARAEDGIDWPSGCATPTRAAVDGHLLATFWLRVRLTGAVTLLPSPPSLRSSGFHSISKRIGVAPRSLVIRLPIEVAGAGVISPTLGKRIEFDRHRPRPTSSR